MQKYISNGWLENWYDIAALVENQDGGSLHRAYHCYAAAMDDNSTEDEMIGRAAFKHAQALIFGLNSPDGISWCLAQRSLHVAQVSSISFLSCC